MKKLLIICLTLLSFSCFGQAKTEQYCEIVATSKLMSTKVTISIDFGEARSVFADTRMKDESGKARAFNSVMDALNFMGKEGWRLVNAFPITAGGQNVYHYVMKKEFDDADL